MSKHAVRLMFFSGFYESIHNLAMESEEEYILEDYPGKTWDDFNWKYDWEGYAKSYVSAISSEIGINLEFRNLWSPREYNFATDEIYCLMDSADVEKISSVIDSDVLSRLIKERFTSRSGFSSFYSNDIDEWKEKDVMECEEDGTVDGEFYCEAITDAERFLNNNVAEEGYLFGYGECGDFMYMPISWWDEDTLYEE